MKEIQLDKNPIKNIKKIIKIQNIINNYINIKRKPDKFKNIYHNLKFKKILKKLKLNIFKM